MPPSIGIESGTDALRLSALSPGIHDLTREVRTILSHMPTGKAGKAGSIHLSIDRTIDIP